MYIQFYTTKRKKKYDFLWDIFPVRNIAFMLTLISLVYKTLIFACLINTKEVTKFSITSFPSGALKSVYVCFILALLSIGLIFKKKGQKIYYISLMIIYSIFVLGDLWYYRGFEDFFSLYFFQKGEDLAYIFPKIFHMIRAIDIVFIMDLPIFTYFIIRKKFSKHIKRRISSFFIIIIVSVGIIGFKHNKVDIEEDYKNYVMFKTGWNPKITMTNLSPIGYHLFDIYNHIDNDSIGNLDEDEKKEIKTWYEDKYEDLPKNKYKGLLKNKNLIVIQVESLESFVLNQKTGNNEITPNLNKLLKNSIYFSNFHEQINGGGSSDADLTTNTSMLPIRHGSTFFKFPRNKYISMPNLMEDMGYDTIALHSDKGAYWNVKRALESIGFNKVIDSSYFDESERIQLGMSDGSYFPQTLKYFKEIKKPFYGFMVTLTSHGPFNLPQKYRELGFTHEFGKTKLGGYFESVHYTDKAIGKFLEDLDKEGILEDTVVVITGDHGGVHRYYNKEVEDITPYKNWWREKNYRIPFIIYNKKLKGEEIKTYGGQIDIMPTLYYLMGGNMENIKYSAIGKNLLNTNKNYTMLNNKTFLGDITEEEKTKFLKAFPISDKMIRSNYFKKFYTK